MSAHGAVIPPASPRERLKDRGFRACSGSARSSGIAMLALLLYDVAADGFGKLSWDFVTSFPSARSRTRRGSSRRSWARCG